MIKNFQNVQKVYSSESQIKRPGQLFRSMIVDLWNCRSLAFSLMKRDISVLYRQSFFGFAWAFIPSILTAVTFSFASRNKVLNVGPTEIPYTAYVMFGVVLWQTFSEAVIGPVNGLASSKSFITKINFPREALFVAKFGEAIFNFLIKCVLIAALFIYYGILPEPEIFFALGIVLLLIILGQAIGLLLAPFSIIYQDFSKGLPLVLGLGMFITPVVYPMPTRDSIVLDIVKGNPMTYLISSIRDLCIFGTTAYGSQVLVIALGAVLMFLLSWLVFRLSMPYIIERCS